MPQEILYAIISFSFRQEVAFKVMTHEELTQLLQISE